MPCFALQGRTLKADTPKFSTTSIFVNTAKGNGGFCTWKCFGCCYGQLGIGFWRVRKSGQATSGDEELIGAIGEVSSVGFGAECECDNVAQKVGTTILFRRIRSVWCKISLWKMLATYNLPAEVFYNLCPVQHTQTVCPQLRPAHKRKSTEYNYCVIHWLMTYTVFTMLANM